MVAFAGPGGSTTGPSAACATAAVAMKMNNNEVPLRIPSHPILRKPEGLLRSHFNCN